MIIGNPFEPYEVANSVSSWEENLRISDIVPTRILLVKTSSSIDSLLDAIEVQMHACQQII